MSRLGSAFAFARKMKTVETETCTTFAFDTCKTMGSAHSAMKLWALLSIKEKLGDIKRYLQHSLLYVLFYSGYGYYS